MAEREKEKDFLLQKLPGRGQNQIGQLLSNFVCIAQRSTHLMFKDRNSSSRELHTRERQFFIKSLLCQKALNHLLELKEPANFL